MTLRKVILTPELVEEARLVYDAGAVSVEEIAAMLGIKRAAFFNFRKKHGWKPRRPFNHPERSEEPAVAAPIASGRTLTPDELIPKIEAAINREFAHVEHALAHGEPRNAEKTARTMASLVRSLAELKRVQRDAQGHGTHNDGAGEPPARDLADLKAELARRLDRLRRARDAERGS
ncbi:MAG: hypothetical protein JOZ84_10315 [Methylobacteriaceae bacterium]|nr:hypothetical protein [Methylobacteriaceae bacterium]